jgi:hypothetical protein
MPRMRSVGRWRPGPNPKVAGCGGPNGGFPCVAVPLSLWAQGATQEIV